MSKLDSLFNNSKPVDVEILPSPKEKVIEKNLQVGDRGFVSNAKGVQLYFEVKEVTYKKVILHVINGNYDMKLDIYDDIPDDIKDDYNAVFEWRKLNKH